MQKYGGLVITVLLSRVYVVVDVQSVGRRLLQCLFFYGTQYGPHLADGGAGFNLDDYLPDEQRLHAAYRRAVRA